MVDTDHRASNSRLAALMKRAETAFKRSRLVVEEARQVRAMVEARRSAGPVHGMDADRGKDLLEN
ncbi:hypothetical protein [Skermanella pratensis]|uniref:hypothetical protein n=1 Tax=Skermanella pratensis TaxID=2233999 RepID=UPI0013011363|nr:hypothetical protein [Skermanella pratensis]